jgi:hypothetical protein
LHLSLAREANERSLECIFIWYANLGDTIVDFSSQYTLLYFKVLKKVNSDLESIGVSPRNEMLN